MILEATIHERQIRVEMFDRSDLLAGVMELSAASVWSELRKGAEHLGWQVVERTCPVKDWLDGMAPFARVRVEAEDRQRITCMKCRTGC